MRLAFLAAATLALASCGSSDGGNNSGDEAGGGNDTPPAAAPERTPDNLTMDAQNAMTPVATPSPRPLDAFPVPFQGRWGMVAEDCDPARSDAKGLMTLTADAARFYESRGAVSALTAVGRDQIRASLALTGEGQSWRRDTLFTLVDGGRTLIREETTPAGSFRYTKCPA